MWQADSEGNVRIPGAWLIERGKNDHYGIVATAISLFIFAYSSRFGAAAIVIFYCLWLLPIAVDYRRALGNYFRFIWIYAFAVFCGLSVFWSDAPSISTRSALQYFSQIACALIAMRVLGFSTLAKGCVMGCAVVLAYSLFHNSYDLDPFSGSSSFVGAFSSKNQLGLFASLALFFSYATVAFYSRGIPLSAMCFLTSLMAVYCLAASQSATATLTTAAVIGGCMMLQLLQRFSPEVRKRLLLLVTSICLAAFLIGAQNSALATVLGAFGKDTTLTGRTYLWQQGLLAASDTPLLGRGYQAYWVQGFSEPERLWSEFYIGSRNGFHFHNTYIEALVETGAIGSSLLAIVFLSSVIGYLARVLHDRRNSDAVVAFGISMLLFVRSFVEIDVIFPYQVGSFLLYFVAGALTLRRERPGLRRQVSPATSR